MAFEVKQYFPQSKSSCSKFKWCIVNSSEQETMGEQQKINSFFI